MREQPNWRSLLYVPATAERFVAKAHTRGADVVILDLEDSIPPAEKQAARDALPAAAATVGQAGAEVCVRINRPLEMAVRDIEAAVMPAVAALLGVNQVSDLMTVIDAHTFQRPIYAGNAILTVQSTDPIKVITVRGTAFAAGERTTPWGTLGCELRAVNHRYLEVGTRLPEELRALEPQLRERIAFLRDW